MRKIILSISFILAASVGFTHAQNVFKKHGFKKKPLTFCDGQYNEFFNNPEVVQIGTVMFNTRTNKIVELLDENTSKTTYKAEFSSMCLDPHAEKYYSISPYAYCAGNPVRYVDLKGMDLFDVTGHFIPGGDNSNRVLVRTNNGNVPLSSLAMNNMNNRQTAANIAGYYGNQIGIHSPGNVGVGNNSTDNSTDALAYTAGKNIFLNAKGGLNKLLDDKNNMKSNLFHEEIHKNKGQDGNISGLEHAEVFIEQMSDKSFANTTNDFKNEESGGLMLSLAKAITGGAQDSQIQEVVDQYNKLDTGYQISYKRTGTGTNSYEMKLINNK